MNAVFVRPATLADLPALAAIGVAGLPFAPFAPFERLLVADDGTQLLACVGLRAAIGLGLPRYWYHVGCTVHAARELDLFHRQHTLLLGNDHTGASELVDLAWLREGQPLSAQAAALRLVVDAALLTLARERDHFASRLIVELPGPRDSAGQSPFWAGLGRHFYAGDPVDAQARLGSAWRSHVAALLPRHPVIAGFLPPAAQAAIAQVAQTALVLRELLEAAGLRYAHHVCIDDGGPVLEADLDALPGVTRCGAWRIDEGDPGEAIPYLVMNAAGQVRVGTAQPLGLRLTLDRPTRAALALAPDDPVWARPL